MRKFFLLLLLAALLPAQAQAAQSVAGSWPTNEFALTDGATITMTTAMCPGQPGSSGVYTLTVLGNNHTIALPQCVVPSDFKFIITQGAGGPYTGLSFSSAGKLTWPGGVVYTQTNIAGALDYVSGTISNLTGSNEWDVTSATNVAPPPTWAFVNAASCNSASGPTCTTTPVSMTTANLIIHVVHYATAVGGQFVGPTDSSGNTYTLGTTIVDGSSATTFNCYYSFAPTVTGSMTFSANMSGNTSAFNSVSVAGFSGAISSPLDQTNTANSGATSTATSQQPGSITPTQPNELLVACLGLGANSTTTSSVAIDSSYTIASGSVANAIASTSEGSALGYHVQGAAAATNPTFSWAGGAYGLAGIMSFK